MKAGRYELDVQTKGGVAPACRQCIIAALAALWIVAAGRAVDHFVTVMVIFFEMTGGLCGT